jgi:hypothetical protein
MASSSSQQEVSNSSARMVPEYDYRGRSMKLEEWELQVQIENPVDFESLAFHECCIRIYF